MKARFLATWLACYALCLGSVAGVLLALHEALPPPQQQNLIEALSSGTNFLFWIALIILATTGFLASWIVDRYFRSVRALSDSTRLIAAGNPSYRAATEGPAEMRKLAESINLLAARHEASLRDDAERAAIARADLEAEKIRLATLMAELAESVVVCNMDGRILLYNERARALLAGANGGDRSAAAAQAPLGLGRSLFALIDRDIISHTLDQLQFRRSRGEHQPVSVLLTTIRGGRLLRGRAALVTGIDGSAPHAPAGFVLVLEDVGQEAEMEDRRERLQQRLIEGSRSALANIRAAAENLINYPGLDAARRHEFTSIITEEAEKLTRELDDASRERAGGEVSQWSPEQMRAVDLISLLRRRIESLVGIPAGADDMDATLWLSVDSYSMAQVVSHLARRLKDEFSVAELRFRVAAAGRSAHLDLVWTGARIPSATALAWENEPVRAGADSAALTLRNVLQRHRAVAWHENDRNSACSWFRIALPLASPAEAHPAEPHRESRPVYYDFDLFSQTGPRIRRAEGNLKDIAYTVFDTETTGLEPSAGDEIISIGAVRIVNGRLLASELFEQLVDPRRAIPASSVRIHGIRPEMLEGQPTIATALPAFHKFCEDTVLVGHNVAFDMRFLELKQAETGVSFSGPVLDTMLLSAVLHRDTENHSLEALAERYGVDVVGRHTAVGDAIVTAEIFIKMIPLLAERGIVTLLQARAASRETVHARVRY
jgi:DNA polymerase-3 subunit epsilon